jgi:hypothetical protein
VNILYPLLVVFLGVGQDGEFCIVLIHLSYGRCCFLLGLLYQSGTSAIFLSSASISADKLFSSASNAAFLAIFNLPEQLDFDLPLRI